jgi:outer membrane protein OmpA-like peptidoglycan-associated protein
MGILIKYGDFSRNPLPDENAYTMINRDVAEEVYKHGISGETAGENAVDPLTAQFKTLTADQWSNLKVIGTLQVEPISFTSSSRKLGLDSKKVVDNAVENLKGYPNFRIMIQGHTSKRGNAEGNKTLSNKRAKAVARYMEVTYGIDSNRMLSTGFGGGKPLRKKAGESMRAYNYRLSRVELILVSERF